MKSNLSGVFEEENKYSIKKFEIVKWFCYFFCCDMLLPFLKDPFFIMQNFFFSDPSYGSVEIFVIVFFIIIPFILLYFYTTISLIGYLQAVVIYLLVFEWVFEQLIKIILGDLFLFLICAAIFLDFFFQDKY